jgi:hypothetical protein
VRLQSVTTQCRKLPLFHDIVVIIACTFPYKLICAYVLAAFHLPCTNFVIPEVVVYGGICRSTADVQLVGFISDSNQSVLLNQSISSSNIVCRL